MHARRAVYKAVAVGRLIAKKGPIFLLEAFRQMREAGMAVELFVFGDGPFREPMQQYLRAAQLDHSVHLLGERP